MTAQEEVGASFLLTALFFPVQVCRLASATGEAEEGQFQWGWDWQWVDHDHFEVGIIVSLAATRGRPYDIEVAVTGRFKPAGEDQPISVPEFAHRNGPAILFPYVRQAIDDLTSRAHTTRLLLPPINVQLMMAEVDPSDAKGATEGRPAPETA